MPTNSNNSSTGRSASRGARPATKPVHKPGTTTPAPGKSRAHLSSHTDDWPTPEDFYAALDAEFGFVLDVCASKSNHKAPSYYALDHPETDRRDGLAAGWAAELARLGGPAWMNPPYGRTIAAWMLKAHQTARAGAVVVALVPVRADTAWWHQFVLATGAEVRYVRGRLTFGDAVNTAAFASAVVIYRPTDVQGAPGPVFTMPAHPELARAGFAKLATVLTPRTSNSATGTRTRRTVTAGAVTGQLKHRQDCFAPSATAPFTGPLDCTTRHTEDADGVEHVFEHGVDAASGSPENWTHR